MNVGLLSRPFKPTFELFESGDRRLTLDLLECGVRKERSGYQTVFTSSNACSKGCAFLIFSSCKPVSSLQSSVSTVSESSVGVGRQ